MVVRRERVELGVGGVVIISVRDFDDTVRKQANNARSTAREVIADDI